MNVNITQTMETDKEYKKRVIDTKSKSFCGAKWYNATIWLGSGQTVSCHHPLSHAINVEEIKINPSAIHNTTQKKLERAQMQKGERPTGCDYCWKLEDAGQMSDRVAKTKIHAEDLLQEAFESPLDKDFNLRTLEIAFDRTCQFACSYCNPAFSTTWAKDINANGPYNNLRSDGRNHFTHPHDGSQLFKGNDHNPYVEAFFKWWESDLHETLNELRITGGEPLMTDHTWRLLEWFQNNKGQSKTRLAINSNLGFGKEKLDRLLEAAKNVELDIYTSNESIGAQAEYIRDGLNYEQWKSNVEYLLQTKRLRRMHVMCTINALCLESLPQLLDQVVEWKRQGYDIGFSVNILRFPSFQSVLVLSRDLKDTFAEQLSQWLVDHKGDTLEGSEVYGIERLIGYINDIESCNVKELFDFKHFYEQYDKRRNKDFAKTFPVVNEWYKTL